MQSRPESFGPDPDCSCSARLSFSQRNHFYDLTSVENCQFLGTSLWLKLVGAHDGCGT